MSIIRLIHITIDPSEIENAMRVWILNARR